MNKNSVLTKNIEKEYQLGFSDKEIEKRDFSLNDNSDTESYKSFDSCKKNFGIFAKDHEKFSENQNPILLGLKEGILLNLNIDLNVNMNLKQNEKVLILAIFKVLILILYIPFKIFLLFNNSLFFMFII